MLFFSTSESVMAKNISFKILVHIWWEIYWSFCFRKYRSQNYPCNVYLKRFINFLDLNYTYSSIYHLRNKPDVSLKIFYYRILFFVHWKMNRRFLLDVNYLNPLTLPTIIFTVLGLLMIILFILFGTLMDVFHILSIFFLFNKKDKVLTHKYSCMKNIDTTRTLWPFYNRWRYYSYYKATFHLPNVFYLYNLHWLKNKRIRPKGW